MAVSKWGAEQDRLSGQGSADVHVDVLGVPLRRGDQAVYTYRDRTGLTQREPVRVVGFVKGRVVIRRHGMRLRVQPETLRKT